MSSIIRTGIIGYGLSGRVFHAPFIDVVEGYELTKISTSKPENVKLIEERYPVTAVDTQRKRHHRRSEIDLVIVTSPNTEHFRWAREALIAGKHVVVEKPFTVNVAEADELIEIAQRQGKILTVYHNRRFTSDTKTVRKILESGILGEIVDYESHFDRYRPNPRPGGAWREDPLPGSGIFTILVLTLSIRHCGFSEYLLRLRPTSIRSVRGQKLTTISMCVCIIHRSRQHSNRACFAKFPAQPTSFTDVTVRSSNTDWTFRKQHLMREPFHKEKTGDASPKAFGEISALITKR